MEFSIEEQKEFLSSRLKVEPLRATEQNREDIKNFIQSSNGNTISEYLQNTAWEDDCSRNTKVFLVRDQETKEIVFYYAINCGILFSDLNTVQLNEEEKEPFAKYVQAIQILKTPNLNKAEMEKANIQVNEALMEFYKIVKNPDRISVLISMADDKVMRLEEKREAISDTKESEHIQPVQETFPAIDIKFLGRNKNYVPAIKLSIKLGVYIFWEIIVPHILTLAEKVGCKYIYLFAADNTEQQEKPFEQAVMWTPDYDPYDEDDEKKETREEIHELVDYYMNELRFRYVSKYKILKPHYERQCYTLVQEVDDLESNRAEVWQKHILDQTKSYE